jgi:hypothetical protein
MYDVGAVRVRQPPADGEAGLHRQQHVHRLFEPILEGFPLHELEGKEPLPRVELVQGGDVRMIEDGRRTRLELHALARPLIPEEVGPQELEGHGTSQPDILGPEHLSHGPGPEAPKNLVVRYLLGDHGGGRIAGAGSGSPAAAALGNSPIGLRAEWCDSLRFVAERIESTQRSGV